MLFAEVDPKMGWYVSAFFVPLCAVFVLLWMYNRRESRRRRAAELANQFGAWGLTKLSHIFSCYSIGDYSGFIESIHALRERIQSHGLPDEFRDLFEKLLAHFAKDETWRDKIQKSIDAAEVVAGTNTAPETKL